MLILVLLLACRSDDVHRDSAQATDDTSSATQTDTDDSAPSGTTDDSGTACGPATLPRVRQISDVSAALIEGLGTVPRVSWTQHQAGYAWVEFEDPDDELRRSPEKWTEPGSAQEIILGVTFDQTVRYRVAWRAETKSAAVASPWMTIDTETFPKSLPALTITVPEKTSVPYDAAVPYLLGSVNDVGSDMWSGSWWAFIIDRKGRVLWARESSSEYITRHIWVSNNGEDLLLDHCTYWRNYTGEGSQIWRMKLDGEVIHTYEAPDMHHPFLEANEAIYWMAKDSGSEALMRVDDSGASVEVWHCSSIGSTSCGTNGMFWREDINTMLVSSYSLDTMIEVDPDKGAAIHLYGQRSGSWAFDPPDSTFDWQHGPMVSPKGNLLVSSKRSEGGNTTTVVYEYAMDEETETLVEVWRLDSEQYSVYGGDVELTPNGNVQHNLGSSGILREYSYDRELLWEVAFDESDKRIGRTTALGEDLYRYAP